MLSCSILNKIEREQSEIVWNTILIIIPIFRFHHDLNFNFLTLEGPEYFYCVCLSVCLIVCLSVCLIVTLLVCKIQEKIYCIIKWKNFSVCVIHCNLENWITYAKRTLWQGNFKILKFPEEKWQILFASFLFKTYLKTDFSVFRRKFFFAAIIDGRRFE